MEKNYKAVTENQQNEIVSSPKKSKTRIDALTIAKVAILTALSWVLYMYVKVKLPAIFPVFLEMQISDLPALIGGFAIGPVWGCVIIVLKCLLKMPFTSTACVGEIGDIIIGIALVLPATLIYKYQKTRKGALLGIAIGIISSVIVAILVNRFILVPFYVKLFFGGNFNALIDLLTPLYSNITQQNFYNIYLWAGIAPFNLIRCLLCGGITFVAYKSLSRILH